MYRKCIWDKGDNIMTKEQRVAVITGSTRGIGRGIAEQLGKDGYALVINGSHQDTCEKAARELSAKGFQVVACAGDVSKKETHDQLVKTAVDHFGRLDTYVNNAGIAQIGNLLDESAEDFHQIYATNVDSVLLGSRQRPSSLSGKKTVKRSVRSLTPQVLLVILATNSLAPTLLPNLQSVV